MWGDAGAMWGNARRAKRTRRRAPCSIAGRQNSRGRTFAKRHGPQRGCRSQARLLLVHPVVDVLLDPVLGIAVARLNLAFELLAVAVDLGDIVIGKLAPLLLHLTAELLPAAFDAIPIHVKSPVCCC